MSENKMENWCGSQYSTRIIAAFTIALALSIGLGACSSNLDPDERLARAAEFEQKGDFSAAEIELKNAIRSAPERGDLRWHLAQVYLAGYAGAAAEKELRAARKYDFSDPKFDASLVRALLLQNKNIEVITEFSMIVQPATEVAVGAREADPELVALVGHAYLAEGKLADAGRLYDRALQANENLAEALHGNASIKMADRDFDAARELLNRAVSINPGFDAAWANLGALESHLGNLEKAEQAYTRAIEAHRIQAQHYFDRFNVRLRRTDFDGASQDLKEFSRRSALKHLVSFAKGLFAFHRKDYGAANDAFEESLAAAPQYLPALAYAGLSNALIGRSPERAMAQLTAAIARDSTLYEAEIALAITQYRVGDYVGARKAAGNVLAVQPSNQAALRTYASAALAAGNVDEAIQTLSMLLSGGDASADLRMQLGVGLMKSGALEQGIKELETAAFSDKETIVPQVVLFYSYLRSGAADKAESVARTLIDTKPEDPMGWNLLGGVALSKNDLVAARDAFAGALRKNPGNPSASHNLATLMLLDNDTKEARRLYEEVLQHNGGHVKTLIALSDLSLHEGDRANAQKFLDEALKAQPNDVDANYAKARFFASTGAYSEALELLKQLLERDPKNAAAAELVAEIRLTRQEPGLALDVLEPVARNNPRSPQFWLLLAQSRALTGDVSAARNDARRAMLLESRDPVLYLKLARFHLDIGDLETAKSIIDGLKERIPDTLEVAVLDASWSLAAGDLNRAREQLAEKLDEKPGQRDLTLLMARAESGGGDEPAAVRRLESYLASNSGDTEARLQLASLFSSNNRADDAIREYELVAKEQPNNAIVWNNLAWLLRDKDRVKALEYAERAVKLAPKSVALVDTLAVLLTDNRQAQRAIELLTDASSRMPELKELRVHLAQAHIAANEVDSARKILVGLSKPGDNSSVAKEARDILSTLP